MKILCTVYALGLLALPIYGGIVGGESSWMVPFFGFVWLISGLPALMEAAKD